VVPLDSTGVIVTNCSRGHTLHYFRDIAFEVSNIAIFGYPSCVSRQRMGSPGTISVKFYMEVSRSLGYKWRRNFGKNFNTNVTDRRHRLRQMDLQRQIPECICSDVWVKIGANFLMPVSDVNAIAIIITIL